MIAFRTECDFDVTTFPTDSIQTAAGGSFITTLAVTAYSHAAIGTVGNGDKKVFVAFIRFVHDFRLRVLVDACQQTSFLPHLQ